MTTKLVCPSYDQANWSLIPSHMQEGMRIYIESGITGGTFLTAVLSGDLTVACAHADDINRTRLQDYMMFLTSYAPAGCHGSSKNVSDWCKRGGLNGTDPAPDNGKPKIFAFVNGGSAGWYHGAAIAEDGTPLDAGHCSSSMGWSRHDMGADGQSTWKHEIYAKHYPEGFQVEWVENVKEHPVLWPLIEKLNAKTAAEKALEETAA